MNMHVSGPGTPQDALYFRTPITPEEAFQAIGRLRKEARDEIDRLIRFLDKTDDYVSRELEDGGDDAPCDDDEREASFSGVGADGAASLLDFDSDELAADSVRGGDAEAEPSLGSVAVRGNQSSWSAGGSRDLEGEHDGREPDVDDEPSLCGITADKITDDRDLEADLGSFDRMVDQRKSLRVANLPYGHADEIDEQREVTYARKAALEYLRAAGAPGNTKADG